ncbi:reticulophagy regulator 1 [Protopterus annectens]|uniref:reticulophagy regulator 1 n=1 Tax=Protopterus annectens TaxID=7888 RepID=UPI001CF948C9|nr:reticulophagy regulator 1 [Protopterus annectens]
MASPGKETEPVQHAGTGTSVEASLESSVMLSEERQAGVGAEEEEEVQGDAVRFSNQAQNDISLLNRITDVLSWQRPFVSASLFICSNAAFWFTIMTSWSVFYLMSLGLLWIIVMQMIKDLILSRKRGAQLWRYITRRWDMISSKPYDRPGLSHGAGESWQKYSLFLQEMSLFKQQNPGKFCLLVCSLCAFFAIIGRYIPGVVLSYCILLCAFICPLLKCNDVGQKISNRLKTFLLKLDFGFRDYIARKRRDRLEKAEIKHSEDNSEADISALCPKISPSVAAREMSVSDTEPSEPSWTENGTFNLSEGHTPQTDTSDDLDRPSDQEELFAQGLAEFPSLDNGNGTNDDDSSIGIPTPPVQSDEMEYQVFDLQKRPSPGGLSLPLTSSQTVNIVRAVAGDAIAAAVSAALKGKLQPTHQLTMQPGLYTSEETDTEEADDFELLDQSELEQSESELEIAQSKEAQHKEKEKASGFLSNLLGSD